ncbi:hypothetical protein [Streptomyces sp. NPDC002692]
MPAGVPGGSSSQVAIRMGALVASGAENENKSRVNIGGCGGRRRLGMVGSALEGVGEAACRDRPRPTRGRPAHPDAARLCHT